MVVHKEIASIIPGMMALSLVGKSAKTADDSLKGIGKKGDTIKSSVDILIGVPLIGAVAGSVSKL